MANGACAAWKEAVKLSNLPIDEADQVGVDLARRSGNSAPRLAFAHDLSLHLARSLKQRLDMTFLKVVDIDVIGAQIVGLDLHLFERGASIGA
ncbi:protein of unknown function [Methylocella tundrae]|uniref:Uncharacterized protein n=1 Tax=Methylocella tundrae TaxID=227605 RepID=A0A4U8Z4U2_METTU|nr:protein of unknown function [Methylocella tundrae]